MEQMEKKAYEKPEMEVVEMEKEDVILTSGYYNETNYSIHD